MAGGAASIMSSQRLSSKSDLIPKPEDSSGFGHCRKLTILLSKISWPLVSLWRCSHSDTGRKAPYVQCHTLWASPASVRRIFTRGSQPPRPSSSCAHATKPPFKPHPCYAVVASQPSVQAILPVGLTATGGVGVAFYQNYHCTIDKPPR